MSYKWIEKLGREISAGLFQTSCGVQAEQLKVILPDGRDCGGWSEKAAADFISRQIATALRKRSREAL